MLTQKAPTVEAASPLAILGSWFLIATGSPGYPPPPVAQHILMFHVDGTVSSYQADGAYPNDSESDGGGSYFLQGSNVVGAFVETRADRTTHDYLGYARIEFTLMPLTDQNSFSSKQVHARVYDTNGNVIFETFPIWTATRILPFPTA